MLLRMVGSLRTLKRVTVPLCTIRSFSPCFCEPDLVTSYWDVRKYIQVLNDPTHKPQFPLKVQLCDSELSIALSKIWNPICWTGNIPAHVRNTSHDALPSHLMGIWYVKYSRNNQRKMAKEKRRIQAESLTIAQSLTSFSSNVVLNHSSYDAPNKSPSTDFNHYLREPYTHGRIGRLIVILDSPYTGGELEITHKGVTKTVFGPGTWVAFTEECSYTINAVTDGTRCLLVFDVYKEGYELPNYDHAVSHASDSESDTEEEIIHQFPNLSKLPSLATSQRPHVPNEILYSKQGSAKVLHDVRVAVDRELTRRDDVIIALQNLYLECQTSPAFLKDGDRALYELLTVHYDVQLVAATVQRGNSTVKAALYSTQILRQAITEPSTGGGSCTSKIIFPRKLGTEHVLEESPFYDTIYIVSALRVLRKELRDFNTKNVSPWYCL